MKLPNWISNLLPTRSRWMFDDSRQEPAALAHTLDVDKLGSILRSAEAGEMEDLFSLYRDIVAGHTHVQAEFGKRKLAVVGDDAVFTPRDKDAPGDVVVSENIEEQVSALPNWLDVQLHLLDSTLFPLSLVEKIYRPSDRDGWMYELAELRPVPYPLIDYTTGKLMLWDTDANGNRLVTRREVDPTRFIVHRGHALTSVRDTWGGPMRAVTFWYLFSVMDRSWWGRFLDRYGAPFMEASYDEADDTARLTLSRAFAAATKVFGIAVPKSVQLKMHQANASGSADAFEKFHAVANAEMSKVIVGQTMSATAAPTGLNNSQGDMQEQVRQDIRQFDARRLGHTLRTQLFIPLCQVNGWDKAAAPKVGWGGESADDMAVTGDILTALPAAGLRVTDAGIEVLSQRLGLPLERLPAEAPPMTGLPLAAGVPRLRDTRTPAEIRADRLRAANDAIALAGAEDFAAAMGESLAPVIKILSASESLDDFERRLAAAFPGLPSRRAAEVLSAAMISNSANAVLAFPDPSRRN
jgi:phage gp29-like protein